MHIVQPFLCKNFPHPKQHLLPDLFPGNATACFRIHFKGIFCSLPELIIFQPFDTESFDGQWVKKFPVSSSVFKPKDIFVSSQKPHCFGKRNLFFLWRLQGQTVRKAVPDQRLCIVIKAGKVHHSIFHLNDIHIIKKEHPFLRVCFHPKGQGFTGSIKIDNLCPEYVFQIDPQTSPQWFAAGNYPFRIQADFPVLHQLCQYLDSRWIANDNIGPELF